MVWLITGLLLFAAFFVVVLPGAILAAAVLIKLRRSPEPELRLCVAADVTDPAAKPCFAFEGARYCERHGQPDQRAS